MSELSHNTPANLNDLTEEIVELVHQGKVDDVRALLARLLSHAEPTPESHEFVPGERVLAFRGIVGELRVPDAPGERPVEIATLSPAEAKERLAELSKLAKTINDSVRQDKKFLDAEGKPTPASSLTVDELAHEIGRIILTRMEGWIRVEDAPTVPLH